jgi:ABC-type nitrate/sulfonate/bicarbonate transport system permease component
MNIPLAPGETQHDNGISQNLKGTFQSIRGPLVSLLAILIVLLTWFLITDVFGLVRPIVLPSPSNVLEEVGRLLEKGYTNKPLWIHVRASLFRTFTGLILGLVVGIPLGLLVGYYWWASAIFSPFLSALRPIPPIAFIPLVVLYFGIGEFSKILLIFMAALWYVALNTSAGVKSVPSDLMRAGLNMGLNQWQLFLYVIFPSSLPYIMTGIKTSTAVSWAIVVAAELVAAQEGLGYMVMDAATFFRVTDVYIGIALIGMIGILLEALTMIAESRLLHWRGK